MKYIEVKQFDSLPNQNTPAGLYFFAGNLYVAGGGGMYPIMTPVGQIRIEEMSEKSVSTSGVSEDFVLKLLAIGNKPSVVHNFTKG